MVRYPGLNRSEADSNKDSAIDSGYLATGRAGYQGGSFVPALIVNVWEIDLLATLLFELDERSDLDRDDDTDESYART